MTKCHGTVNVLYIAYIFIHHQMVATHTQSENRK